MIIRDEEQFIASEVCVTFYQFQRMPHEVINGVTCFQQTIEHVIQKVQLTEKHDYVDNITLRGHSERA